MKEFSSVRNAFAVLLAVVVVSVGVLTIAADGPGEGTAQTSGPTAASAGMSRPQYNKAGELLRPDGYQRWTLVGTSQGLDYSEPSKEGAEQPGVFHNVYVQPEAFDAYVATGAFPEQTVFVVTNNPPMKRQGANEINRRGQFAGEPTGLEVSVKDSKRFEEGWGYYMFHGTQGPPTASKPHPREACYDCHATHGQDDAVFVQFYTVLSSARAKRLAQKR